MAKIMDQFRQHKKQASSVDTVATEWPESSSPSRSSTTTVSPPASSTSGTEFLPWGNKQLPLEQTELEKTLPSYPPLSPLASEAYVEMEYDDVGADADDGVFNGEAIALFDFEPDSDNEDELPLARGQIIDVLCRRGQGWLLAQNPDTQACGLVPEEFVRLLGVCAGGMMRYDFEQLYEDEMAGLVQGQVVWVVAWHSEGWLVAEDLRTGECGLVPEGYVRRLGEEENRQHFYALAEQGLEC